MTLAEQTELADPGPDGMDLLDGCHRRTALALDQLAAMVSRLSEQGADAETRRLARQVHEFFSTTVRQHHDDEERHVFPRMLASGDAALMQTVLRLQTDHNWLEEDWLNLSPQLLAVAEGHVGYEVEALREWSEVFIGLLRDHMALEESVIYPQARAKLGERERHDIGRQIASRRRGLADARK
ncbi:hemerythrin domain-containing protein [Aquabacterium sp.]|uniref:hemerythrin domain-containing protein n=1 Tax=Aquabacterium sp. TaxID=1872578 RepID=UPI003783DD64